MIVALGAATKFVILDPTDGTVDAASTVERRIEEEYGYVVSANHEKKKDGTLLEDGLTTEETWADINKAQSKNTQSFQAV